MLVKIKILLIVAIITAIGVSVYRQESSATTVKGKAEPAISKTTPKAKPLVSQTAQPASTPMTKCTGNTLSQKIIVSVGQQHLWACSGDSLSYESPIVTGMELYPADLTPAGTYKIYSKYTNQTLKGCDGTGCWNDYVNYWMPFLYNKYGTYGFHDATWRSDSQFGNVNINAPYTATEHGSHGCVELPLATAKWVYSWVSVGTTVSIVS